jgi:hypothetical protein
MPNFQEQDNSKVQENKQVKNQIQQNKDTIQKSANPFLPPDNPASNNPFLNPNSSNSNPFVNNKQNSQVADNQPIQREEKTNDAPSGHTLIHTIGNDATDIATIKDFAPSVTRIMIIGGGFLKVYNAVGGHLIQQFAVKSDVVSTIPQIYYLVDKSRFYPLAITDEGVTSLAKPEKMSEADKKVMDALDKSMTTNNWFVSSADAEKCYSLLSGNQVIYLVVSKTGGGAQSKGGSEGESDTPPKPKWATAYETEMNKLIKDKKAAEPAASDMPAMFAFYYSKSKANWRGMGAQKDSSDKLINKVYFDVEEKTDKTQLLDLIRTKIRIEQLNDKKDSVSEKDAKTLKPELLWAYEMKLQLEKRIAEEKKKLPNALDLPDKLAVVIPQEDANRAFLQLHVYVDKIDNEGKTQKELKSGTLPEPLNKDLKQDDLLAIIRKATLGLRGMIKSGTNYS